MTTIKITEHGRAPGNNTEYWWNVPYALRHDLALRCEVMRSARSAAAYPARLVREAEARYNGFGRASERDLEHKARAEARLTREKQEFIEWLNANCEYECTPQRALKNETARQMRDADFFRDGHLYA